MRVPVTAPMLGKILRLAVAPDDEVQEEQTVVVLEAMKMEIEVVAAASGRIVEIKVAPGDAVDAVDVIAVLESPD